MKSCKHFVRPKQQATLRKLFSLFPIPPPSDKTLLHLWNKKFLKEIYRTIQTFALQCKYEAVQIFFLTPDRNMFTGKFVKSEMFLAVLWEHIILNVKEFEFCKMRERNCIVKRAIFFASFCWLSDFLLENLKLKKTVDVHWNFWTI